MTMDKGDWGYNFPCGDSHSRIDYAYGLTHHIPPGPRFSNRYSGEIYHPTREQVLKFRAELVAQKKICDLFLSAAETSGEGDA
jgi:hypothetical protein